jgi:protein-L-isoaspartate(D-aspartate) O-methyltransferase
MSLPVSDSSEEGRDSLRAELQLRGVRDLRVLKAILSVPREKFVPDSLRNLAYRNRSLPIGLGQTISQPLVIAHMLEALQLHPTDRVLEAERVPVMPQRFSLSSVNRSSPSNGTCHWLKSLKRD